MKSGTVLGTFLALAIPCAAFAAAPESLAERRIPKDVPRTSSPVTVDAVLDDAAWRDARRVTLEWETWPAENIPARAATEAFITYDGDNVYVAFIAHDPDPELIRAHLSDRDLMFQDDFVGVVLDTFNDERRGFEFFVNPLGVQGDLFQDDINDLEDSSYDTIWESAGRITDDGYIVEMALPFRSLRFEASAEPQVWGIEFLRIYPRDERHQFRARTSNRNLACYLCEFPKYRGFAGVDAGNKLQLTPVFTASRTEARPGYGEPFGDAESDVEPGLDLSWGITPNVILNATLNPDFSQVEADAAELDVNNQFALLFPERRPFFLEGQDLFDEMFDLVYTRNIADPDYGAKVTGKEGSHAFGAFFTDDRVTNLIFPGPQFNEFGSFAFDSRNAVARYRYDLAAKSTVGALATRRDGDGYSNAVFALDSVYRFSDSDRFTLEYAESQTEYPDAIVAEFGQPAGRIEDDAVFAEYERNLRDYFLYATYKDIGENFRADLGFLPQVGYDLAGAGGGWLWHGKEGAWYRKLEWNAEYDIITGADGQELQREVESYLVFNGSLQSYVELGVLHRRQFFDGVTYRQTLHSLYGEFKPGGMAFIGAYVEHGDAIDFANSRPGRVLTVEPWADLRFGSHFALDIDYRFQRLDVAGGRLFTARIAELRGTWQFDPRMFVRWVAQHRDIDRNASLYIDAVDANTRNWVNQFLFSYKLNPRTLLFAGYSDAHESIDDNPLQQQTGTIFLKISYAWQL